MHDARPAHRFAARSGMAAQRAAAAIRAEKGPANGSYSLPTHYAVRIKNRRSPNGNNKKIPSSFFGNSEKDNTFLGRAFSPRIDCTAAKKCHGTGSSALFRCLSRPADIRGNPLSNKEHSAAQGSARDPLCPISPSTRHSRIQAGNVCIATIHFNPSVLNGMVNTRSIFIERCEQTEGNRSP
jgi:hypothetical protein